MKNNHLKFMIKIPYLVIFPSLILLCSLLLNTGRFLSAWNVLENKGFYYFMTDNKAFWMLTLYTLLIFTLFLLPQFLRNERLMSITHQSIIAGILLAMVSSFYADVFYLVGETLRIGEQRIFPQNLHHYGAEEAWFYLYLFALLVAIVGLKKILYPTATINGAAKLTSVYLWGSLLLLPLLVI